MKKTAKNSTPSPNATLRILTRMRFSIPLILSLLTLVALWIGYQTVERLLPLHYPGYITEIPETEEIRLPIGGYVRTLHASAGEQVNPGDKLLDIIVTGRHPLDEEKITELFKLRAINARFESQQGGLRKILLSPDLRERAEKNPDFNVFLANENYHFGLFKELLETGTLDTQGKFEQAKLRLNHISKEIIALEHQREEL